MASSTHFSDDDSVSSETEIGHTNPNSAETIVGDSNPETITDDSTHGSTNNSIESILRSFDLPELLDNFQSKYFYCLQCYPQ